MIYRNRYFAVYVLGHLFSLELAYLNIRYSVITRLPNVPIPPPPPAFTLQYKEGFYLLWVLEKRGSCHFMGEIKKE